MSAMTINDIYTAINPLPAMLTAKGKISPEVSFRIEANAGVWIAMNWRKSLARPDYDKNYEHFLGVDFHEAMLKAVKFIEALPSAKQAQLNDFMGHLGKVIDEGKAAGIDVDYLNPLLDTMKRLSENALTYVSKENR